VDGTHASFPRDAKGAKMGEEAIHGENRVGRTSVRLVSGPSPKRTTDVDGLKSVPQGLT
jgi:hypothetical protein